MSIKERKQVVSNDQCSKLFCAMEHRNGVKGSNLDHSLLNNGNYFSQHFRSINNP